MITNAPGPDTLLVDFNNTVIRGMAAMRNLSHDGVLTGGLYGFLTMLSSAINALNPGTIVVCNDQRPYWRERDFPAYKQRPERPDSEENRVFYDSLRDNKTAVLALCEHTLNIPVWAQPGLEADDLMAHAVQRCAAATAAAGGRIVLLSNDDDLYQLLAHDNVFLWRKQRLYGAAAVLADHGVSPDQWCAVTALAGSHNGVPGIKGIGLKKAAAVVHQPWLPRHVTLTAQHAAVIRRNQRLIQLPYPGAPLDPARVPRVLFGAGTGPRLDRLRFLELLSQYGIRVTEAIDTAVSRYRP